ncbi:glycosyltransferase family 4 protein [Prosthecobacter sp.]|uniref:glycosyltransferase family 4 protein n=1 Tax=Prosthecobacter sp. TaxID=1965333 RepID=UPI0037843BD6
MQVLISHLTGNPNSSVAALALAEAGYLAAFHTTIVIPGWLRRWAVRLGLKHGMWDRRIFPEEVQPFLHSHPMHELLRLACRGSSWLRKSRFGRRQGSLEMVLGRFDLAVARVVRRSQGLQAVYAYMDAAEHTFLTTRQSGIRAIYELPTPYWRFTRDIVTAEATRLPEWAQTLPDMDENSETMKRRDRELQLADLVIVPSELVRESLRLAPPFKATVHVVPYGCPEFAYSDNLRYLAKQQPSALRVLYVGSLNQGKGLAYLAEAMTGLEDVAKLTVIGSRTSVESCVGLDRLLSAANRYRTGLSHGEVLAEMRRHDVLVLPTLYEGLALVLLEAMACGLTVITTPHSGIDGLIEDGKEGFLVPIRNAAAIHNCLRQLAEDSSRLQTMQLAALTWSRAHSWRRYRELLLDVIAT